MTMDTAGRLARCAVLALLAACATTAGAAARPDTAGIESFNHSLTEVTTRIDSAGLAALWEDDGISLLPATAPLSGKRAILAMFEGISTKYPGAHVLQFELSCSGIEVVSDFASEVCEEHQRVALAPGQPPFEGWGKLLLVLHRGPDGKWRLRREMWNEGLAKP